MCHFRPCLSLVIMQGLLVSTACHVAEGATVTLDSGTRAEISSAGTWKIARGNTVVVSEIGIGVWNKDGSFSGQGGAPHIKSSPEGGRYRTIGTIGENGLGFEAVATRCSRGMQFSWRQTVPSQDTWGVILKLPRKLFAGCDFVLDGKDARTFPKTTPGNPRFFSGNVQSLLTARIVGNSRLLVDWKIKSGVVLQDATKWGDQSYHIVIYPREGVVSFLLSLSRTRGGPEILTTFLSRGTVERFRKFELTLDVWGRYSDAYDLDDINVSADFLSPSGRRTTVSGFLYREYLRAVENDVEKFEPAGDPVWKIRFTPIETGSYSYSVTVRTRRGISPPVKGGFTAIDSQLPGFVGVGPDGTHFSFTDGTPYFAIGHNVCWPGEKAPLADYTKYFEKMEAAGENFTRIWLCSWGIGLETGQLDEFDLEDAWKLDQVLASAEKHGIYIKLCLENFWDFTRDKKSPYWKENGGFCEKPEDFFEQEQSWKWTARKYRYALQRWGYSPNILAWELWNEADYAIADKPLLVKWHRKAAEFLKATDPFGHMVTTSLGLSNVDPEIWQIEEIDFVQIHSYIRRLGIVLSRSELDAADLVGRESARVSIFGKPFLVSEFGYLVTEKDPGMNAVDTGGLHLHNALWASALSGAAGTCMSWWWDSYIHKNDLYHLFAGLSRFLEGEEKLLVSLSPVAGEGKNFRVLGLRGVDEGLFWVQNKNNTWYHCAAGKKRMQPLKGAVLKLSDLVPGRYLVQWWDTRGGGIITSFETEVPDGVLSTRPPASSFDAACKIRRISK